MTRIQATSPLQSRIGATDFLSAVKADTPKTQAAQKAFFNALLASAIPAADLAKYRAAIAKLNATKAGQEPEGGYGALSKTINDYVILRNKCIAALKPFTNETRTSPDTFDEIEALSTQGLNKASGKGVDDIINKSGLSKADLADAFSAPVDFDKFVDAQFQADPSLDINVAESLRRKFYDEIDPRS